MLRSPGACGQPGTLRFPVGYAPPPGDPTRDRGSSAWVGGRDGRAAVDWTGWIGIGLGVAGVAILAWTALTRTPVSPGRPDPPRSPTGSGPEGSAPPGSGPEALAPPGSGPEGSVAREGSNVFQGSNLGFLHSVG